MSKACDAKTLIASRAKCRYVKINGLPTQTLLEKNELCDSRVCRGLQSNTADVY